MMSDIKITISGKNQMEEELAELRGPRRDEISRRLKSAIEMGDLSENADYKAAKEDQGFLEGRIQEIEMILSKAILVDETAVSNDVVQIGNTITICEEDEEQQVFELVGAREANIRQGKISYQSPMGAALMGKRSGDTVEVKTPGGLVKVKLLKIA